MLLEKVGYAYIYWTYDNRKCKWNKTFIFVYYESRWNNKKNFISIKYDPHAFMYIVDELICSCISIECILCVFIASIHRGLCSCCIMK